MHERSDDPPASHELELWGGVECTVNRVGDRYFDQMARTGHMHRLDDLDRFADLGLRALRFPLLWEHVQPDRSGAHDWRWADRALERLRERGVRPIVGLLHHGFGPRWIDVRDPDFGEALARYAGAVAERYPWVDAYTPINEPLTTARFSALYGHWYPHGRDGALFARVLLAQIDGIARAMRAVRRINPDARLVQTEDLGQVASTPALAYQRDFENERRWLTWDMLSGMLAPGHPCWHYLRELGCGEDALAALRDDPCAADVIGINHYITSERYLDERVERYALDEIGGNGRDVYADVAQVQVDTAPRAGIAALLRQAWHRYRLPIAVTECHLGCTREEQMRWLHEVWDAGARVKGEGVDLRAITSWALLGSHDWNSLVTRECGHYEPGAFDARGPSLRPTALATMVRALATRGEHAHPVLDSPGWWDRRGARTTGRPILMLDAGGPMGRALAAACATRGLAHVLHDGREMDAGIEGHRPWVVIDALGDPARTQRYAERCARRGIRFVALTSAFTLDGEKTSARVESDVPPPRAMAGALVIRTGNRFGSADEHDPLMHALLALGFGESLEASDEVAVTPAYAPDLAHAALDLLIDGEHGVWHLSNRATVTPYELIARAAGRLHVPTRSLTRAPAGHEHPAMRPAHRALASERGWPMPSLESALDRYAVIIRERLARALHRPSDASLVIGATL